MNKFFVILFHTYISRLKSKSFIITTIITALLVLGVTNLQQIITLFEQQEQSNIIAVTDRDGEWLDKLERQLEPVQDRIELVHYVETEQRAEDAVRDGEFDGYLQLTTSASGLPQAVYKANIVAEAVVPQQVEQALQQLKIAAATKQLGLHDTQVDEMFGAVDFERVALQEGAKSEEELNQARVLVYVLLFVIYFSVVFYGNMIATEVATEKSSRVMEILISSVSPIKQMFGKIAAVALLGLTQYAVIIGVGYVSIRNRFEQEVDHSLYEAMGLGQLSSLTIFYALLFFLLGYLLYATISAMLGSLVSRIEDVNQMIAPLNLLVIAAFIIAMFGLGSPESSLITFTSFIPFFSPMIMFLRVGMLQVPFWEVAASISILIVTILFFAGIGARVYRGGVLLYGKSSSFKDVKRAIVISKNEKRPPL
ncbi:ABC transporter permease [Desertibacillus haloalkaliphilus]|uniref:ABC transporter permease n=1 Tax=Desertibacillus haloalkaliphilus TaxID=1328930 RepID=UPI001C26907F|nr:ABC transporter permease [Desertibacillus haloalkaliphilus]MBU8905437.1 ABC transporter permease [Desertibacillus haloalkaliphilus]